MADLDDIYSDRILAFAGAIARTSRLAHPDGTATAHSKLCGSTVTVDLALAGGEVADYGQTVKACLLGQAACSIMAREIVGSSPDELRAVRLAMRDMLIAGGPPPDGRWADLAVFQPVRTYKGRHASILIVFDAVVAALDQAEQKRKSPAEGAEVP